MGQNGNHPEPPDELTPGEQRILSAINSGFSDILISLDGIKMQLEELAGRSGSMVLGKSTDDALALYESMRKGHPGMTLKQFAEQNHIPVKRLSQARYRRKQAASKPRKRT